MRRFFLQELDLSTISCTASARRPVAVDRTAKKYQSRQMEMQNQINSSSIETKELQKEEAKTESTGEYPLRHMEKCHGKDQVVDGNSFIFMTSFKSILGLICCWIVSICQCVSTFFHMTPFQSLFWWIYSKLLNKIRFFIL